MYLLIPQVILESRKLSSDEKILLSYIATLSKHGYQCYAKPEYLDSLLGLSGSAAILEALGERNYICSSVRGKDLHPKVKRLLDGNI